MSSGPSYVNSSLASPTSNADGFLTAADKHHQELADDVEEKAEAAENDTSEPARAARRSATVLERTAANVLSCLALLSYALPTRAAAVLIADPLLCVRYSALRCVSV